MEHVYDEHNEVKEKPLNTSKLVFGQATELYFPKFKKTKPMSNKECAELVKLKLEDKRQLKQYPATIHPINLKKA